MEIGKRELPKTRRASDGSVEWRCSKCLLFKPIDSSFAKADERRGYVCKACDSMEKAGHSNTAPFVLDPLLREPCKPVNLRAWERAVWRHIYKHLMPYETGPAKRSILLAGIRRGQKNLFTKYRQQLIALLATDDLTRPDEYFWFVFRRGLLDLQTLRLYAVGVAKYVAQLSNLYSQDKRVEDVLFEARHAAMTPGENLHVTRQVVYDILEKLHEEYNPQPMHKAAMALTAVCFPDPYEAAVAATGWAVESWLATKGLLEKTVTNAADRDKVIFYFLKDLRRLMIVMAESVVEAETQKAQRQTLKFKSGAIDYDAIDD